MKNDRLEAERKAESVIAGAWGWNDVDCSLLWAVDLWYEAMALLMEERAPA